MHPLDILNIIAKLAIPFIIIVVSILAFVLLYRGKLGKLEIGRAFKITAVEEEAKRIRARMMSVASEGDTKPT